MPQPNHMPSIMLQSPACRARDRNACTAPSPTPSIMPQPNDHAPLRVEPQPLRVQPHVYSPTCGGAPAFTATRVQPTARNACNLKPNIPSIMSQRLLQTKPNMPSIMSQRLLAVAATTVRRRFHNACYSTLMQPTCSVVSVQRCERSGFTMHAIARPRCVEKSAAVSQCML